MAQLIKSLFFLLLFSVSLLSGYVCPSELDPAIWHLIRPYLLPSQEKLKEELDAFFKKTPYRIVESLHNLEKAGFEVTGTAHTQKLYVMRHKKFKGWIFKIYTDDTPVTDVWNRFLTRCQGANIAKNTIIKHQATDKFKAPEKYLYLLPESPPRRSKYENKHVILLAEDMDILTMQKNRAIWKSHKIIPSLLNLFWTIVTEAGLADAFLPDNCPFCYDGRIALLDTEQFHKWPIYYPKLTPYLSPAMQNHWKGLIKNKGP